VGGPRLHLICNAHLDPVWQWRWEEGAAETIATFRNAAALLREHKELVFNHNEALLYRWVEQYDPGLFREIQRLVRAGRWVVSGGWYLQPDVNLPGLESLVRQIAEGRRYFREKFRARPRVAYNFDSFGHSGGLPQILRLAGYGMYIHMRPQSHELRLPADLYRWRGVDGSEILTLRLEVGLYHTERDNIEERLKEGTRLALRLGRDVAVFWGLGNHGGGATREDLERIDTFKAKESRVEIIHSTPDRLFDSLRAAGLRAPVVEGDLQRVFTGCYTSLAGVKRRSEQNLAALVQTEALRTAVWWLDGQEYPEGELSEAWREHLLNDFHDILTGSCTQPAERDAFDLYGKVLLTTRQLRLEAAAHLNRSLPAAAPAPIPITVLNSNPSLTRVPVEVECMADYRPFWKGEWHLRVFGLDGKEVPSQEEQPEALLPFNDWRRKLCFMAELPGVGAARFVARAQRGRRKKSPPARANHDLKYKYDRDRGLITELKSEATGSILRGPLFEPLVIEDKGDSWGTGCSSYRKIAGRFALEPGSVRTVERGPVRIVLESVLAFRGSRIIFHTIIYPAWPAIEFRLRVRWNEERKMLKLALPTVFRPGVVLCEIPGGAISRPADGQEHVFGRWVIVEGDSRGRNVAFAVAGCGPHGLDFRDGELRISVLRSAAYCHERGFKLARFPSRKYMDQGEQEFRFLVMAEESERIRSNVSSFADWLCGGPFVLAHLPFGASIPSGYRGKNGKRIFGESGGRSLGVKNGPKISLLSLEPSNIRLTALKRAADGREITVRLHETSGRRTRACLSFHIPPVSVDLAFRPFEIKTLRVDKFGSWREVDLLSRGSG
jgi:alpha-mannosidase